MVKACQLPTALMTETHFPEKEKMNNSLTVCRSRHSRRTGMIADIFFNALH